MQEIWDAKDSWDPHEASSTIEYLNTTTVSKELP